MKVKEANGKDNNQKWQEKLIYIISTISTDKSNPIKKNSVKIVHITWKEWIYKHKHKKFCQTFTF